MSLSAIKCIYFLTLVNKDIYWYFFFLFEFSIEIEKNNIFTTHDLWLTPSAVLVTGAQLHHFAWMTRISLHSA